MAVFDTIPGHAGLMNCPFFSAIEACTSAKQKEEKRQSALPSTTPAHAQSCRSIELRVLPYPLLCLFYLLHCVQSHRLIIARCGIDLSRRFPYRPDSQPISHPANQQATQTSNQPRNQPAKQASSHPNSYPPSQPGSRAARQLMSQPSKQPASQPSS